MQNKNIVQLNLLLHQPDICKINAEISRESGSYKLWKVQHYESRVTTLCTRSDWGAMMMHSLTCWTDSPGALQFGKYCVAVIICRSMTDQWRCGFSAREERMLAWKKDLDEESLKTSNVDYVNEKTSSSPLLLRGVHHTSMPFTAWLMDSSRARFSGFW